MSKKPNHYEMLEESRSAAVQAAANLFDGLAKAKKLRRRVEASYVDDRVRGDEDDLPENEGKDFLFDMLRLNASYVNEVAKLGGRYRDFASRALENMYRLANPGFKSQQGDELVFEADKWTQWLVVQNDLHPSVVSATIDVPKILDPATGQWEVALEVVKTTHTPVPTTPQERRQAFEIEVPFGQPQVVTLHARASVFKKRKYEDQIFVRMTVDRRERERRVPIVLDGRRPPKRSRTGVPT